MANCSNCSAALPVEAGQDVVRCAYCGTSNRVGGLAAQLRVHLGGLGVGCASATLLVGLLVLGVGAAVFALWPTQPETPAVPAVLPVPVGLPGLPQRPPEAGMAPSELGSSTFPGWIPLAAPPMEGSYDAFDPIANLPWALRMARAWSTDAQLGSIYLDGARADGSLDLSSRADWDVDYRFFSPALRRSARDMAEVSEQALRSELRIKVGEAKVKALLGVQRPVRDDPAPYEPRCTFEGVMTRASAELAPRPSYRVVLQHVSRGWRWAVSGKDTGSAIVKSSACSEP